MLAGLAGAYVIAAILILLVGVAFPTDNGPLGLLAVLSPHVALVALLFIPLTLAARSRRLGASLVALALLFAVRFGGEWWSPDPTGAAAGSNIDIATWNVEAGSVGAAGAVALLARHPVDIVVLEELTLDVVAAIEADPALTGRYPYRALHLDTGVMGIGVLSAFPISEPKYEDSPIRLELRVALPDGNLIVLGAHPFHADVDLLAGLPVGLDATQRNRDLQLLRNRVNELDVRGERVVLLGDFNTASSEPGFSLIANGLHDAHAEVGVGPGWTWRPSRVAFLGIGLLRIDLILSTSGLRPVRVAVDCPRTGDHCLVEATLAIEAAVGATRETGAGLTP